MLRPAKSRLHLYVSAFLLAAIWMMGSTGLVFAGAIIAEDEEETDLYAEKARALRDAAEHAVRNDRRLDSYASDVRSKLSTLRFSTLPSTEPERGLFWLSIDLRDALIRHLSANGAIGAARDLHKDQADQLSLIGAHDVQEEVESTSLSRTLFALVSTFDRVNPGWTVGEKMALIRSSTQNLSPSYFARLLASSRSNLEARAAIFSNFSEAMPGHCQGRSSNIQKVFLFETHQGSFDERPLRDASQLRHNARDDLDIIARALAARGDYETRVFSNLSRNQTIAALREVVRQAQCGEQLLIYVQSPEFQAETRANDPTLFERGLATSDGALLNAELGDLVLSIRNKGASIAMLIDAGRHALDIQSMQRSAEERARWAMSTAAEWNWRASETAPFGLSRQLGDYAVFDGSLGEFSYRVKRAFPFEKNSFTLYSPLSYAVAKALPAQPKWTIRSLSEAVVAVMRQLNQGALTVVASNPDASLIADGKSAGAAEPAPRLSVEIVEPKLRSAGRGLLAVLGGGASQSKPVELFIRDSERYSMITVNDIKVRPDPGNAGHFRTGVVLAEGMNTLRIEAFDERWNSQLVEISIVGGAAATGLSGEGKNYLLAIGVENYANFPHLETPHEDVHSVADILVHNYGFQTNLDMKEGKTRDLLLIDPTQKDITQTLNDLRSNLQETDSLLIYFAGHGSFLQDSGEAYWIPKDGDKEDDQTWLASSSIRIQVKRSKAKSILIVADSCFSGAMQRIAPALSAFDGDRKVALVKAGARKSRMLISSGGNEPVLDQGCAEDRSHSIFACAFLAGLKSPQDKVFSAGELFHMQIFPKVNGRTEQQPEYKEIKDSNHDGGQFIFTRVGN